MPPIGGTLHDELDNATRVLKAGYYVWFLVFLGFTILTVGLPLMAALDLFQSETNRLLAGSGALAAALANAIKPHEYATAFDVALQSIWKTRVLFVGGNLDEGDVSLEIAKAIDLTTFRYSLGSLKDRK